MPAQRQGFLPEVAPALLFMWRVASARLCAERFAWALLAGVVALGVAGCGTLKEARLAQDPQRTPLGERTSCLLYTSPSPRDGLLSRMPSSA